MTRNLPLESEQGFTLIEILIAIAILAFVMVAVSQSTISSFKLNQSLGMEASEYTTIMMSLQAVQSDLSQVYSPYLATDPKKTESTEQPSDFWSIKLRPDGLRRSRFKGNKEKVTFITNGNRRVQQDSAISDFMKITWDIDLKQNGSYSHYRTTDSNAFFLENNTKTTPQRVALMENLGSAKFTYYRKSNKTWEDEWDSESPYAKPESRFPDLIALTIEVPDPTNNATQQKWKIEVRPNMTLNMPPPAAPADPNQPQAPPPAPQKRGALP